MRDGIATQRQNIMNKKRKKKRWNCYIETKHYEQEKKEKEIELPHRDDTI